MMSTPGPLDPASPIYELQKEKPSFASNDVHFLESFRVYRERSSETEKLFESFQTHIPSLIQSQMFPSASD